MTFSYKPSCSLPNTCISVRDMDVRTLGRGIHNLMLGSCSDLANPPSLSDRFPNSLSSAPHLPQLPPAQHRPSPNRRGHKWKPSLAPQPPVRPPSLLLFTPLPRGHNKRDGGGECGEECGEGEELAAALFQRADEGPAEEQEARGREQSEERGCAGGDCCRAGNGEDGAWEVRDFSGLGGEKRGGTGEEGGGDDAECGCGAETRGEVGHFFFFEI